MITIKRGDCLELMKEIPAGSVDMILTEYEAKIDLGEFWRPSFTKTRIVTGVLDKDVHERGRNGS